MIRHFMRTTWAAARRQGYVSLLLAALAAVVYFVPGMDSRLQYDQSAVEAGQYWRLVTCHWMHWSGRHLFWDVLMFGVLAWMCERRSRDRFLICLAAGTILLPAFVWMLAPAIDTYRGLSGLDSALFVLLVMLILQEGARARSARQILFAGAMLAAFLAKVGYEIAFGSAVFVADSSGAVPVPLAHLVGAVVGLVSGPVHPPLWAQPRRAKQSASPIRHSFGDNRCQTISPQSRLDEESATGPALSESALN